MSDLQRAVQPIFSRYKERRTKSWRLTLKKGDILQDHLWFPVEMMSKEQAQIFHTSDMSLHDLGSASDWLKKISLAAQTRKTWHHYEISALVTQMLFGGGNQWGYCEMSPVSFSVLGLRKIPCDIKLAPTIHWNIKLGVE